MLHFRPLLNAHGISEQQWRVLRVLHDMGEMEGATLGRVACILPPSLSRMLKSLSERGFVEVRSDPDDGRRHAIRLTEEGEAFLMTVSPSSSQIYEEIEARVGGENIARLLDQVDALLQALESPRPDLPKSDRTGRA